MGVIEERGAGSEERGMMGVIGERGAGSGERGMMEVIILYAEEVGTEFVDVFLMIHFEHQLDGGSVDVLILL